ncbi:MAG: hypothetical protein B0D92_00790 [Spirochaeta sp. LUC14_002_19_P3]|nr:MAG: hypothetical protein B0D92_00790 [Spirochaeta sp. LUC14_002_19_P3]
MSNILPINIDDLLHYQGVESSRVELKASWDAKTTGKQVLKSLCAFANDLQNLNGGYIVIGVEEYNSQANLPPKGLSSEDLAAAQKWIRGNCNRIDPKYQPVMSPEVVSGKHVLVLWVPASDIRPHRVEDDEKNGRKYFVRIGSESVDAEKNGVLDQLMQLTAKVPFDDRRALDTTTDDLREHKVREFLRDIRSGLLDEANTKVLYKNLRIVAPVNGYDAPKNIGLLFFSDNPEQWFPGSRIEIVQYAADAAGNVLEEKVFRGGLHEQLKSALAYLESISSSHLEKQSSSFKVKGWVSYPIPALRESLVNAVYHKSYEATQEPIKVYLYSDRIEIISYPGPVPGIQISHLKQELNMPPVPARNRRIGEFLKELRLAEGRGTGLPKIFKSMRENGSNDPIFDFDEERTYFRVTLPAHPEYIAISALRDAAHLKAIGNEIDSFKRIENAWKAMPSSPSLTSEYMRILGEQERITDAEAALAAFKEEAPESFHPFVTNVYIELLLDAGRRNEAIKLLNQQPQYLSSTDALEVAILARRLGSQQKAHRYFERAGDAVLHDTRALHEFAQTKIMLAREIWKGQRRGRESNRRLLNEAKELLERVIQMDADKARHAWAWRDLGLVKKWLRHPMSEVSSAYQHAIELLPDVKRFQEELSKL